MIPEHLGDYEIIDVVARGDRGVVYRALGGDGMAPVCVKLLSSSLGADVIAQLALEVGLLTQLDRTNLVAPRSMGRRGRDHFVVTDWIDGETLEGLRDKVAARGEPASPTLVGGVALSIARALSVLHGVRDDRHPRGLTHGAVAPSRVLLGADGGVKLLDLGLGRLGSPPDLGPYAAPELIGGAAPDPGSDLYALGAIMAELLSIAPASDPRRLDPQPAPSPLEAICRRALEVDRAHRFPTSAAMLDALESWSLREYSVASPPRLAHEVAAFVEWERQGGAVQAPDSSLEEATAFALQIPKLAHGAPPLKLSPPASAELPAGLEAWMDDDEPTVFDVEEKTSVVSRPQAAPAELPPLASSEDEGCVTSAPDLEIHAPSGDWLPFSSDELEAIERVSEAAEHAAQTDREQRNMRAAPPASIDVHFELGERDPTAARKRPRHGEPIPFTPNTGDFDLEEGFGAGDEFMDLASLDGLEGSDEGVVVEQVSEAVAAPAEIVPILEVVETIPAHESNGAERGGPEVHHVSTADLQVEAPVVGSGKSAVPLVVIAVAALVTSLALVAIIVLLFGGPSQGPPPVMVVDNGGDTMEDEDAIEPAPDPSPPAPESASSVLPWRRRGQSLLVIKSRPPAVAFVNGKRQGKTPLWVVVHPGTHTVTLKRSKHKAVSRKITLRKGQKRIFSHKY